MNERREVLLFTWPWLTGLIVLTIVPLAVSFALSLTKWDGFSEQDIEWVGAAHYRQMLAMEPTAGAASQDARFGVAVWNTLVYAALVVPLGLAVSLALAVLLNQKLAGISLFRTAYYVPHILGGVGTVLVWQWLFNPDVGLINTLLQSLHHAWSGGLAFVGIESGGWVAPRWLHSPEWCKPALVLMHLWGAGGAMLIFLAALQNVPQRLYEAADLDGAGKWQRFRHITLPQISPAILFNLVAGLIGAARVFKDAYLLRHWSQNDGLLFYMLYLYENAFESPARLGYASAMAWLMAGVLFVLSLIIIATSRRWVYYEGR